MINSWEVQETNEMIEKENLDVRTITLGISLLDCIDSDLDRLNQNIYNKITTVAKDLVATGEKIRKKLFHSNRKIRVISVTPIALVGGSACKTPEVFCYNRRNYGSCSKDGRRQSDRRIFRAGI